MKTSEGNFTFVQALRGIAALWVVLFHLNEGGHMAALAAALPRPAHALVFQMGHYGVSVFFALSGFVIAHSVRDKALTGRFFGQFILRRSLRLDPPYWAAILVVIAFSTLSARVTGTPTPLMDAGRIGAHMVYLQELTGQETLDPAFWTLTYEVQFYLFFVGMLVIGRAATAIRHAGAAIWGLFMILALAGAAGLFDGVVHGLFLPLWKDFFIGVLAYRAAGRRAIVLPFALLFTVMMARGDLGLDGWFSRISGLTALVLLVVGRMGRLGSGLNWRPLLALGTISYSLYLLHNPITGATAFIVKRLFPATVLGDAGVLLAVLTASIAAATIFWTVLERPAHRLARRVGRLGQSPPLHLPLEQN